MRINWKLRLKNKTVLLGLITALVAFVYQIFGVFGFVPPVTEDMVGKAIGVVLNALVFLGIIVDPTTAGLNDSDKALEYSEPRKDV